MQAARLRFFLAFATLGSNLTGCAVSAAVQAARARDIPKLDTALKAEAKSGELDEGEARDVAKALAKSELNAAKGDSGVRLVRSLSPCAKTIEGALDDRSEKNDDVAAAAASLMLETDLVDHDEYAKYAVKGDTRPMFRAIGARSLVERDYVSIRLPLFRDLDERVRLGALSAAEELSAPSDFAALVEAARLDPLPEAKAAAARAMGLIGGVEAVHALRDLWTNADGGLRDAIAIGWSAPRSYDAGGEGELVWAAQNDTGDGAIAAALQIVRWTNNRGDSPHTSPIEERNIALGVLARAIKLGTPETRMAAMSASPATPEILDAVRASKDDSDPGVQISAWARLHADGTDAEKKTALTKLYEIAKSDSPEAGRAQETLAWLGDVRVEPLLTKQLASPIGGFRTLGARGLVALGKRAKAASLLADKDVDVRVQAACAILIKTKK